MCLCEVCVCVMCVMFIHVHKQVFKKSQFLTKRVKCYCLNII